MSVLTSRHDNLRTNANTQETLLTPSNVNKVTFGKLFSTPVDYQVLAQPLYVPNVSIAGGIHNVLYVVTQADSVYAIDADTGAQLWWVNFTNTAQGYPAGLTTASGTFLPCGTGPGFTQEGIVGTPVIDPNTNTIYMVAKTLQNNTTVRHDLHALDLSTGAEKFGGPKQISATSVSLKGKIVRFNSLHQKNRPGLAFVPGNPGVIYAAFGSNYCNDSNTGWVLSYDATTLTQLGAFNTSPDIGLTSIWQSGAAPAVDQNGFIYAETAESKTYDVPTGGQSYSNSILKLSPNTVALNDYFTPWSVAYLNANDLDLSSTGILLLPPEQSSPYSQVAIATGKEGIVYVLNCDNLGTFSVNDSLIIQEFSLNVVGEMFGSPAYWNGTVYFNPTASLLQTFKVSNGQLVPSLNSPKAFTGSHSPSISANGNTNGILWMISGPQLNAIDAVSLNTLYTSAQAGTRDTLPPVPHFVTQTVAKGRVYVGTKASVEAYGLFPLLSVTSGGGQSATVGANVVLQFSATNPYTGQPHAGVTVTLSDGGKGGAFNPPSGATDSNGNINTIYTLPTKIGTYTLTASAPKFATATTTVTAQAGLAVKVVAYRGAKQSATVGTTLPNPIVAQVRDSYGNGVPNIKVTFTVSAGTLTPISAFTNAQGLASTSYQLPTKSGTYSVKATAQNQNAQNLNINSFSETALAAAPASIVVTGGNNQTAAAGTLLPLALTVKVADQYNNPVPNASVTFADNGGGGTFSTANPVLTGTNGLASQSYTLPSVPGTYTISASVSGVANPAHFTETGQ